MNRPNKSINFMACIFTIKTPYNIASCYKGSLYYYKVSKLVIYSDSSALFLLFLFFKRTKNPINIEFIGDIDYKIDKPEDWISFAKPLTVSTDNSSISLPKFVLTFLTTSAGQVIISAPTSSA